MEGSLPYHCFYCNATFEQQGEMEKHSTDVHRHHCFYCTATFEQMDDVIKHTMESHLYHCYYCKTTFVSFEDVIKHSTEKHASQLLKVKHFELNSSTGNYGYRSHNFNVIPDQVKSLGQNMQTDYTSNALRIHLVDHADVNRYNNNFKSSA